MNTTNIREGDLVICTNISMPSYLKVSRIVDIKFVPHDEDSVIESVTINFLELFGGCDNWFERIRTKTIPYKDFEYNFQKINCNTAY